MSNLHYVAGLFDGEGTVSMAKPSGSDFYVPMLSLSSTDKVLCEVIRDELAGGHVYEKTSRKPERWSQAYEWRWKGAGCLIGIMRLSPHNPLSSQAAPHDLPAGALCCRDQP